MREKYDLTLEISDIQSILKCGINQAHELCKSGKFHVVRVGRKYKISRDIFFDWFEGVNKVKEKTYFFMYMDGSPYALDQLSNDKLCSIETLTMEYAETGEPWGLKGQLLVCNEGVFQWNPEHKQYDYVGEIPEL